MRFIYRWTRHIIVAIRLFKNWWVYLADRFSLIQSKKIRHLSLRGGGRLIFRPTTFDGQIIFETFSSQEYLKKIPVSFKDVKTVVDLGAQIGDFSLLAAQQFSKATVFAVEAVKENYDLLCQNISINHLEKNIVPLQIAIWSMSGETILLSHHENNTGGHSAVGMPNTSSFKSEEVKTISLDDFFKKNNIDICDLVKSDIEGAEYEVFMKASDKTLRAIRCITLEVHTVKDRYYGDILVKFLESKGFSTQKKGNRYVWAINQDVRAIEYL